MDTGRGEMNWETGLKVCALPCVKQIASGKLLYTAGSSAQCSVMTQRGRVGLGVGERSERGDIGIYTADSLCCTAETNTTL